MRTHLTLRQLEIFLAVVRLGSFRSAGIALNLAPVVVGEHVRALEERLGSALFHRHPGTAPTLTAFGEKIVERAEDVQGAVSRLEAEATAHLQGSIWRICLAPFLARLLAKRVSELRRRFPECQIIVQTVDKTARQTAQEVVDGTLDLAIVISDEQDISGHSDLVEASVVIDEPLAMFAAHDHPLAGRQSITREELAAFPLAKLSRNHPLREVVDKSLDLAGLRGMQCSVETDDYNEILANVAQTNTLGCLFAEARNSDAVTHRLQMLHLGFYIPSPQALMIISMGARKDQRLQVAADFLANHYRADAAVTRRDLPLA